MQGCEAVCHLQEAGPGLGLLTQPWVLLLGTLTGKASVGGVRGREMDKRTSWGHLGHQPYLIHGSSASAWLASSLDSAVCWGDTFWTVGRRDSSSIFPLYR